MQKKLIFLLAVVFMSTSLMAQWSYLSNSGVTGILRSVSVVDNNVAFISGDAKKLLKTTNAGVSWTNIAPSQMTATDGVDVVRAIDANTILAISNGAAASFVYKTTNGGTNWTQVFTEALGYADDIRFKDANNGFMYGDPVGGRWSLWKTTNGGSTWDSAGLKLAQVSTEAGWDNDMCVQGNNIWFGTSAARIYRSTNFGASWISTPTTSLAQSTSITFSGNIGFVTGAGVTMKSTDAGATWAVFTTPGTGSNVHLESLGSRFWIAQTNMYYSTNNGSTFPLSYTYAQTTGPMWNVGANITGSQLTVYVAGYAGGIWKYTETVAVPPSWTEQTSPITTALNSVSAVNDNIAWACGLGGKVVRTINSGINWTNVSGNLPATADCYNIWGIDANNALVAADPASGAFIYKTTNGGTNWTQTYTLAGAFGNYIFMTDANNAYFTGDAISGNWLLKKSTNAGVTWTDWATVPSTAAGWNNAACFIGNNVWFGTNSTYLMYSSNMGANWSQQTVPGAANQYAVWFNSPTVGLEGFIALGVTTNGGSNWSALTYPGTVALGGITGVGSEWWVANQNQTVYYSSNNGTSWVSQYTAPTTGGVFYHIAKARTGSVIWGVRSLGGISRYGAPPTGITPIVTSTPKEYSLNQNYPNPFNPTTKISFALPKSGFVTLKVYDILGKEVTTLVNSNMSIGSYSYEFNASNLTSGIYFYKLESNGFTETKKMMLVK